MHGLPLCQGFFRRIFSGCDFHFLFYRLHTVLPRYQRRTQLIMVAGKRLAGKQATDLKSYLLTLGILCEGYVSNSFLDEVVGAAEKYFRVQISNSSKTNSNGYIICSPEKTKITNADLRPLTLNASGE